MARILLFTEKETGRQIPYSSLKVLCEKRELPVTYRQLGDILRDKEEYETETIKIQRLEVIEK